MTDNSGITILVVDDMPENVTLLSRILKSAGYHTQAANHGAQAIDIARTTPPDMILLDINMPGIDGFETCDRLKNDARTKGIPVIFVSALDNIEWKTKAFRSGAVDFILKPFEYDEVLARVETHLVLRSLRIQLERANLELAERVDELTKSRELLAERERRLSAFVSAMPNLSFVLDEQGRYIEVMANESSLLAARRGDLIGRLTEDVLPLKEAVKILDAIKQTVETGRNQVIEYKIPVLSGGEHSFEGRFALLERGEAGSSTVVLMAVDITERVQLYEEVQRVANLDVLTGCFNRRYFMEEATKEIQRSMRYKRPLALLMMDLDHFKIFNDRYGHQIGDQLLCHMVNLCQKQLRYADILGRYGGEEFVVLMPETNGEGAMLAAERLRKKIEELQVDTSEGKISMTASMGLASLEQGFDETHTLDTLIKSADKALYYAKNAGRNCVRKREED